MDNSDAQTELVAALDEVKVKYSVLLADYQEIALSNNLTDRDSERLEKIYEEAETHPMLNFLLTEIDQNLNRQLGLLSATVVETYKDQQAWLREHLEQMPFDYEHRQHIQRLLAEEGLYKGPIDGVLGPRSNKAMKRMNTRIQKLLSEKGFYDKDIDGLIGKFSVEAIKAFQKSRDLEDSGVPNRETLTALKSNGK